jgi:hypothetical protein
VRAVLVVVKGRRRVKTLSEALGGSCGRPRQLRGWTLYAVRIRWEQSAVVCRRFWACNEGVVSVGKVLADGWEVGVM